MALVVCVVKKIKKSISCIWQTTDNSCFSLKYQEIIVKLLLLLLYVQFKVFQSSFQSFVAVNFWFPTQDFFRFRNVWFTLFRVILR